MISFRYHVVTIVAVFLALGLGVIAGTTVLDQGIVSELRGSIEREKRERVALEDQVERLEEQAATLQGFVAEARAHLVSGKLDSLPVLLVSHEGADPAALTEARTALAQAAAEVQELQVNASIASPDVDARSALAEVLGLDAPAPPTDVLLPVAAEALAVRLADGAPEPPEDGEAPGADLLEGLLQGQFQFVSMPGIEQADLPGIGGPEQATVVVAGGMAEEPSALVDTFMIPLVQGLHADPATTVAAAESGDAAQPFVTALREDPAFTDGMVTVDALDPEHFGGVTLVLALDWLTETGLGGDFGIKTGREALLPDPLPT